MLSAQDNALITQTYRGTPMGDLFRRYWLPVTPDGELGLVLQRYRDEVAVTV
jgi:hypothetical protein